MTRASRELDASSEYQPSATRVHSFWNKVFQNWKVVMQDR